MFNSKEIRSKYLDFFSSKQHAIIPSAPLVPENDPSVLFNTAGMQPLIPYLLGKEHPKGKRIADVQKCVRTNDLEEVGDNTHNTFFEMLGNWSLGDYFKKDSIAYSYEFLTNPDWMGLDPKHLAVTVFEGDEDAPRDDDSAQIWEDIGIPKERISFLNKEENWWAAGDTGPCGPDTEIFYWIGDGEPDPNSNVQNDEYNWMEIWNNVFMEYNRLDDGTLERLPEQNVDTGMGLERIVCTLNKAPSVYETDLFMPILYKLEELTGQSYPLGLNIDERNFESEDPQIQKTKSMRIIADHIRTSVLLMSDGVRPSNVDQGYVLRRLMRRAIREAHKIGYDKSFMKSLAEVVINEFTDVYENIEPTRQTILDETQKEEEKFQKTLKEWMKEFEKLLSGFQKAKEQSGKDINEISGKQAFKLYDTYGFPLEMTEEMAKEHGLSIDFKGFEEAFEKHQEKSRSAAAGKFKGGLSGDSEMETKLHTATHLMLAGLRSILGEHVHQAGSNITAERLRFDFTHPDKVSKEELQEVEDYVNNAIQSGAAMTIHTMNKQEAKQSGVEGSFWERYPDVVTVYELSSPDGTVYSKELCGGPHVEDTSDMGTFTIKKEESSSFGVRRIKAMLT